MATQATPASPVPNQEVISPGEAQATAALLQILENGVKRGWAQNGKALRDAHAKAHGCVLAHFKVRNGLAPVYRVAVFARPASYDAFVRFSNGSDDVQADTRGDARGMAIKLLGIPGRKLLPNQADAQTQDFVAINFPVFFSRDPEDYLAFQKAKAANDFASYFPTHQRQLEIIKDIQSKTIHDVLDETYFSMTPFELGNSYMKYRMRPERCPNAPQLAPLPASTAFDYLRNDLVDRLGEGPACFAFEIQLQTDPKTMPIEDATVQWPESQSPYVAVADITIDRQFFNSTAQNTFCENLSYTPWHALPSLRPVGGMNRIRLQVYQEISKLRHQLNDAPRREPTVSTFTTMENHAPQTRSAETPDPDRYDQGWDQATTQQYYHTPQGAVTLPSAFMRALRMKDGTHLLDRAHMASLGFLPGVPAGNPYPVGMADTTSPLTGNIPMAGMTCAACHTGQLQYRGAVVRIDGGSANIDFTRFLVELHGDLYRTAANPAERKAFLAEAVANGYPKDKASAGLDAEVARYKFADAAGARLKGGVGTPGGPARVDALTGIAFNAWTLGLHDAANVRRALAPTNYPPLWDIWRFDWVQYNAFASQPMARNVGEAVGLGAQLNIVERVTHKLNPESTRWKSSVQIKNIFWMENQLARLQPPPWPAAFGAIDARKAAHGRALFDNNCARCHGVRQIAGTDEWSVRVVPLQVIGTDPSSTIAFASARFDASRIGMGAQMPGAQGLANLVKILKEQAYSDAGIPKSQWGTYDGWNRPAPKVAPAPCGLKARPLVGIWATPPFLHNGTVPSVYDMLSDTRPAHPIIGNPEFDPHKLGTVQEATAMSLTVDTTLQGNSNAGHWFTDDTTRKGRIGPKLTEDQKYALIEYLKSATYATYPTTTIAKPDPLPCGDNPNWASGIRYDPEN